VASKLLENSTAAQVQLYTTHIVPLKTIQSFMKAVSVSLIEGGSTRDTKRKNGACRRRRQLHWKAVSHLLGLRRTEMVKKNRSDTDTPCERVLND